MLDFYEKCTVPFVELGFCSGLLNAPPPNNQKLMFIDKKCSVFNWQP
jgi:hypothetical protein